LDGINRVSTFKGFCKEHDNDLFEPIDNFSLTPNNQQIFLYSYRSLCKEVFVKENALNLMLEQIEEVNNSPTYNELLSTILSGIKHGYKNLCRHKKLFDEALKNNDFDKIKYVVFTSETKPFMAFSGVLYPEYDFMGNRLQDLSSEDELLDLISFCSAPVGNGWGFIFAWHISSSISSRSFMRSLATMMHEKIDTGDLLFRFVIASCENIAFSPDWYESLSEDEQKRLSEKATTMADIFTLVQPNYLQEGLSGISKWNI